MCGRYTHKLTWGEIVALYRLTTPLVPPNAYRENFNTAPTHVMPIIRPTEDGREAVMAVWALIPHWVRDLSQPVYNTINARSDSIREKPTYKIPFEKRRCIVSTTGWYEWKKLDPKGRKKQPYHLQPTAPVWAFGGVWNTYKAPDGLDVHSFSIVTTDAQQSISHIHDRMPLVLEESQFDAWMRGTPDQAAELMRPYAGRIDAWEVGPGVGNVKNNSVDLMSRLGAGSLI
jgi:putative SOS response-associated peptidase YedK